jgi:glucose/arabinose dehydrogenase
VDPIFAYGHDGDPATTGCAITGDTFYNPTTVRFPQEYEGDYFFADFCNGWIRSFDPSTGTLSGFALGLERPIDLEVSEDDSLYCLMRATTDPGSTASVSKIGYAGNP